MILLTPVLSIILQACFIPWLIGYTPPVPVKVASVKTISQDYRYQRLNDLRTKNGEDPLATNTALVRSANESAKAIFTGERSWSHDGYEAYVSRHYKNWMWIGENLCRQFGSYDECFDAWLKSEPHLRNMLDSDFKEVGIGNYKDVWVVHFGLTRPKSKG